jgi:segregation and condensation protein B
MQNIDAIIEALIFASEAPLASKKIHEILEEISEKEIRECISRIGDKYRETASPLEIIEVAGGYQIVTRSEFAGWLNKLFRSRTAGRLTAKGLETLSIIAYRQPITKQEIENIRGVNVDGVVRTLIERDLITVTGRHKAPGNPLLYGTTPYFLEYFGLKSIADLPKLKEIDELIKGDEKFLESLDQVTLEQMLPERLGFTNSATASEEIQKSPEAPAAAQDSLTDSPQA